MLSFKHKCFHNLKINLFLCYYLFNVSKFVEEKRVFNEIEFYLPQLAHLIVHLEIDWTSQSLERLLVVLCQQSIHIALQLCFILIAYMEDYQPENANGTINSNSNLKYFFRCARLLQNVERAVVFGSSTSTSNEEENLLSQSPSLAQFIELKDAEKKVIADQIIEHPENIPKSTVENFLKIEIFGEGFLMYKREVRQSMFKHKGWNNRYFKINERILLCYKTVDAKVPVRAISLEDCELFRVHREKYKYQFELKSRSNGSRYQLRAADENSFNCWVALLQRYF